jgi:hypothetical protein
MSLRHALIGLLAGEPASGWDLRRRFQEILGSVWPAGQTQQIAYVGPMNADGHIYELVMYQDHPWSVEDIMSQPIGAAPADGFALVAFAWKAAGTKHLVTLGVMDTCTNSALQLLVYGTIAI